MRPFFYSLLASASVLPLIAAVLPDVRFRQGCVVLQQKLYCYGGGQYVAGGINYNTVLNDHFVLDLSKDFSIESAQSAWTKLPPPKGFVLENNYAFASAAISNTSYIITSGSGYNDGKTPLKNKTTIYHADTDQWESVPTTANQSVGATINFDQNGNGYFFGGIVTYTNVVPNNNFLRFNVKNEQWTGSVLTSSTTFRADHAAAMDSNGIIYYVGGRFGTPSGSSYTWNTNVPMTSITTYDTKKQAWGNVVSNGRVPSVRHQHTFTYMPKANRFILYGGKQGPSEDPGTLNDICFTFDPDSHTWTYQNVDPIGSGSRFGHSAVLYMDTYLFIIFGADQVTMSSNDFKVLDVNSWTWLDNFNAAGHPTVTNPSGNGNGNGNGGSTPSSSNTPSGTSGGAIAGAVIGVLALLGIAGAGIFFFIRRKRNQRPSQNHSQQRPSDFVMDQDYGTRSSQHFSPTVRNFMTSSKANVNQPALDYQLQQQERAYHPDEMSASTAPTYTSATPLMVSPTSTFAPHNDLTSRPLQYKPDLTCTPPTTNPNIVKPHATY